MHPTITQKTPEIAAICRRYGVRGLAFRQQILSVIATARHLELNTQHPSGPASAL